MAPPRFVLHFLLCFLALPLGPLQAQPFDYPSAKLSTRWTNNRNSLPHTVTFNDGTQVRNILLHGINKSPFFGPTYACGFFCQGACDSFLFAVYIVQVNSGAGMVNPMNGAPQVVWSANRDRLVKENATIELTGLGDLVLRDANGAVVWSTRTAGKSVAGVSITEIGNLVLLDNNNNMVWQSFDHPTDALILGQSLREGQRLTANTSATNWAQGQWYLTVQNRTLIGYVVMNPSRPTLYYNRMLDKNFVTFTDSSFGPFRLSTSTSIKYLRLECDGHLRTYQWASGWQKLDDLLPAPAH